MNAGVAIARVVFLGACLVCSNLSFGQGLLQGDRELDELHERILRDPSNVELSMQYIQAARLRGDYEAAISAYERLLLYNPSLTQLKYDLGTMYFELGSYAPARTYFEAVAAAPDAAGELRDSSKAYITEIDRRLSPNRFTGYLNAGIRYQTNANAGPASDLIRFGGQSVNLETGFAKQPDWNSYALATLFYEHDFGNERGDSFETSLTAYYSRQFQIERLNLGLAELQAGPRLALLPEYLQGASVKLYGIVNGFTLGDRNYLRTFGSGVSVRTRPTSTMVVEQAFEYRQRKFYDSADYPVASEQSGDLYTYTLAAGGLVLGSIRWIARVGYDWSKADFVFWSYERPFIDLGMPMTFVVPWFGANRTWVLTPYVGASYATYGGPDPSIDPNVARRDREVHVGTTLDAELAPNAGVRVNVHYARNDSNLVNYAYRNLAISIGPAVRF